MENNNQTIKEQIMKTIDIFYQEYKLPEMKISEGEWDALIDTLRSYFSNQTDEAFINILNILIKRALNLVLIDNSDAFTLYHIIMAMSDLKVYHFTESGIMDIKNRVMLESLKNNTTKRK